MSTQQVPPRTASLPPAAPRRRITWSDLTSAQRKYARELYIDEGWPLCEALLLAKYDGAVANG